MLTKALIFLWFVFFPIFLTQAFGAAAPLKPHIIEVRPFNDWTGVPHALGPIGPPPVGVNDADEKAKPNGMAPPKLRPSIYSAGFEKAKFKLLGDELKKATESLARYQEMRERITDWSEDDLQQIEKIADSDATKVLCQFMRARILHGILKGPNFNGFTDEGKKSLNTCLALYQSVASVEGKVLEGNILAYLKIRAQAMIVKEIYPFYEQYGLKMPLTEIQLIAYVKNVVESDKEMNNKEKLNICFDFVEFLKKRNRNKYYSRNVFDLYNKAFVLSKPNSLRAVQVTYSQAELWFGDGLGDHFKREHLIARLKGIQNSRHLSAYQKYRVDLWLETGWVKYLCLGCVFQFCCWSCCCGDNSAIS